MNRFFVFSLVALAPMSAIAQVYPQYNGGNYYASPNSSPVVVPPTVIMPGEHNSSKKSCKESMIDLFLFSVRRTTGDCTP
jgi:hypothetical protein